MFRCCCRLIAILRIGVAERGLLGLKVVGIVLVGLMKHGDGNGDAN